MYQYSHTIFNAKRQNCTEKAQKLLPVTTFNIFVYNYSKTCVKRPLKIDKTKNLMTNGSLLKVESIAECSPWSILQHF